MYNYDRLLVIGMSGSGKSYFVNELMDQVSKRYKYRVFSMKLNDHYPRKNVYIPQSEDLEQEIDEFVKYGLLHAPITLVWEDLPNYLFNVKKMPILFKRYLIMGRQVGIGHVFISQKLKGIPTLIPMQCNKYAIFKTVDLRDFQMLRLPNIDVLTSLNLYHFLYYDLDTGMEKII